MAPLIDPLVAQLETWADLGPLLKPYVALIHAERQRILGGFREARIFYLDAIELAHAQGYVFLEAFANEALGELLHDARQTTADTYLRLALGLYRSCRAHGKEIQLLEKYPIRLGEECQPYPEGGGELSELATLPSLDIDYLMKAARVLSAETDLDSLRDRFIDVMLEVSGAQSGFFLIQDPDRGLVPVVERHVNKTEMARQPVSTGTPELCIGIVHYAIRTKGPVVLDDAMATPDFMGLAEVQAAQLRSVLCLPILQQGKVTGVLYLENRLYPGLFTPNKIRMAELLTAQATVSLENAQLINDMRQARDYIKQLNATLEQRVKEEVALSREKDHLLIRQSRLALMGEMIGNIAHQWRQPLNALGLVLENIRDAEQYRELTPEYLDRQVSKAHRLIKRMSSTINDFRNFFKPDKQKEFFNPKKNIEDALSLVSSSFQSRAIEIVTDAPDDVWIEGYPSEYTQVLLNLLTNAKEAIQGRGVKKGRIVVRLREDGESVRLTVADNGGGINAAAMDRLFEPYFSTKSLSKNKLYNFFEAIALGKS